MNPPGQPCEQAEPASRHCAGHSKLYKGGNLKFPPKAVQASQNIQPGIAKAMPDCTGAAVRAGKTCKQALCRPCQTAQGGEFKIPPQGRASEPKHTTRHWQGYARLHRGDLLNPPGQPCKDAKACKQPLCRPCQIGQGELSENPLTSDGGNHDSCMSMFCVLKQNSFNLLLQISLDFNGGNHDICTSRFCALKQHAL